MATTSIQPVPTYGTQAVNAPKGQVAVYNPNTGTPLAGAGQFNPNNGQRVQQTPINAGIIGNTQALPIPKEDMSSTTGSLTLANNSATSGIKTDATTELQTPKDQEKGVLKNYLQTVLGNISGQANAENNIRNELDVADKKQKATAIAGELDQLDKGFRDEVNQIKQNTEGKFGAAIEQDITKAQDRYENRRANVSLAYKVAYGDFQGAEELVNQKIDSLRTQNSQQLQAFNSLKELVYNDLTDSEKRIADEQSAIRLNKAKTVEDTYASVLSFAAQNKAPASVLSAIDAAIQAPRATAASVIAAAGKYGVDPSAALDNEYKRAQINNTYSANRANQKTVQDKIIKINGTDYIQNKDGSFSIPKLPGSASNTDGAINQIDTVNSLLTNTKGLKASVGTTGLFGRGGNYDFGSSRGEFQAGIQQLTSQLTLDNLINAKARGATFGALSEGELGILAGGATKLNSWAKKDKSGNITSFKTSEANVKRELDKISNFAKKDFILKGGDPAQIGAQTMPDGTIWVTNSDGTLTLIQ